MDQENKCLLEEGATPPLRETSHQQKYKNNVKQKHFFFMVQAEGKCTVKSGAVDILFT